MSALRKIGGLVAEYREEFGLTERQFLVESTLLFAAIIFVAAGGWTFAVVTP